MKLRKYTERQLTEAIKNSTSLAQTLSTLSVAAAEIFPPNLARCYQIKGFTEFDSIHTRDFALGAQRTKSVASAIPPPRPCPSKIACMTGPFQPSSQE